MWCFAPYSWLAEKVRDVTQEMPAMISLVTWNTPNHILTVLISDLEHSQSHTYCLVWLLHSHHKWNMIKWFHFRRRNLEEFEQYTRTVCEHWVFVYTTWQSSYVHRDMYMYVRLNADKVVHVHNWYGVCTGLLNENGSLVHTHGRRNGRAYACAHIDCGNYVNMLSIQPYE